MQMFQWGGLGCLLAMLVAFPISAEKCKEGVGNPDGLNYAWRGGNICEGVCRTDVSGRGLELASLHRGEASGDLPEGELLLRWQNDRFSRSRLHIRSLDPTLCYRVDARVPAGVDSFRWDTGVARKVGLTMDRLGFVVRNEIDGRRVPVLLPSAAEDSPVVMLTIPEFPVTELAARVVGTQTERTSGCADFVDDTLKADEDLETTSNRRSAAGDVVRLELVHTPACGSWDLELAVTPAPGVGIGPKTRIVPLRLGSRP